VELDGLKARTTERVDLSEFFDKEAWIEIRRLGTVARAEIREIVSAGLEFEQRGDGPKAGYKVRGMANDSAERQLRLRNRKLASGVVDHSLTTAGVKVKWCEELWDALDEVEPRILEKVIGAIDRMNEGFGEIPFSGSGTRKK
jgi:hypothetical protein